MLIVKQAQAQTGPGENLADDMNDGVAPADVVTDAALSRRRREKILFAQNGHNRSDQPGQKEVGATGGDMPPHCFSSASAGDVLCCRFEQAPSSIEGLAGLRGW